MSKAKTLALSGALLLAAGTAGQAADLGYDPVAPVPPVEEPSLFNIAFGIAGTTNYIARGVSQTNAGTAAQFAPAAQGWIEATYGIAYAGIWASNVNLGVVGPEVEVDLSAGIRPVFGALTIDLGYVYYLYTVGPDSSDIYVKASLAAGDNLTLGANVYVAPGPWTQFYEGTAAYTLPTNMAFTTTVSGAVGFQTGANYWTWNAGVTFGYQNFALDLRYHDANAAAPVGGPAYFVATASWKTDWRALAGN